MPAKKQQMKFNVGAVVTEPGSSINNKTGGWRNKQPVVEKEKCIKCGICWQFCPEPCITITKNGAVIDLDFCKGCGICATQCPVKCISMKKEEK